ncbi:MAG TPA: hypothetical protein VJJ83_00110, partial [Candidatus Babeliales bacterium]|nr:hypothetical protein [Candidatus Babeliales bacterium]
LTNCLASNTTMGNTSSTGNNIGFNSSALTTFNNCLAQSGSIGTSGSGYIAGFVSSAAGSRFINCAANSNTTSGTGGFYGFSITGNSIQLQNCQALNNNLAADAVATTASYGFNVTGSSCNLTDCVANQNSLNAGSATVATAGFLSSGTSNIFNSCIADNNIGGKGSGGHTYGFQLSGAKGNQLLNCKARNNNLPSGGDTASNVAGFYSASSGISNEFRDCSAVSNGSAVTSTSGVSAGIWLVGETRSQIVNCDCTGNTASGTTPVGTSAGVYLSSSCSNNTIKDCSLKFNVNSANAGGQLWFGFYDDAGDTTSVLINNVAIGQGRCIALLTSSFQFPANTSMNYYFKFTGDQENPANMIHETDNFNWQTVSTAVQNWSNISVAVGEVS